MDTCHICRQLLSGKRTRIVEVAGREVMRVHDTCWDRLQQEMERTAAELYRLEADAPPGPYRWSVKPMSAATVNLLKGPSCAMCDVPALYRARSETLTGEQVDEQYLCAEHAQSFVSALHFLGKPV